MPIAKTTAPAPFSSGPAETFDAPGTSQRHEGPDGATSANAMEANAEQPIKTIDGMILFIMDPYQRIQNRLSRNNLEPNVGKCSNGGALPSSRAFDTSAPADEMGTLLRPSDVHATLLTAAGLPYDHTSNQSQ